MLAIEFAVITKHNFVLINLHVQPGAKKTEIVNVVALADDVKNSEFKSALKLKVHAPPIDGKANEEIVRYFSKILNIAKSEIEIIRGELSKEKVIQVSSLDVQKLINLIQFQFK